MKKILCAAMLPISIFASVSLDIYSDKVRLNDSQIIKGLTVNFVVPAHLELTDFDVSSSCDIAEKTLSFEIEVEDKGFNDLSEELDQSYRLLSSLVSVENLLKTASLEQTNIENFDKVSSKTTQLLLANLQQQSKVKKEMSKLTIKLEQYKSLNPPIKTRILTIKPICKKDNSSVDVSYDFEQLDVKTTKKIYGDLEKKATKIDEFLYLKNISSLELKNVKVRSFGTSYIKASKPDTFNPEYLDINKQNNYNQRSISFGQTSKSKTESKMTLAFNQGVLQNLETLSAWEIENVNIPRNNSVELNLNTQTLASKFSIFIDGYHMSYPFVESKLILKNRVSKGDTKFYLNGQSVADSSIPTLYATVEQNLYFGINNHILVSKKELTNFTENSMFGSKTQKQKWEYEIRNTSTKIWEINLSERLPVSKSDKITVTLQSSSKPFLQKEDGQVFFNFALNPGEVKKFEFGYEIKKPKN